MKKTFSYRLYPSNKQKVSLAFQLSEARFLYNAALQERKDAWKVNRKSLNYYDQCTQLKEIRNAGHLGLANFSACQAVLRRLEKTFTAFFNRIKRAEKAGYPRFKNENRFNSFTYPKYGDGCKVKDNKKLYLQGVGDIKIKLHRNILGIIKTVTVKQDCGKWYVFFSCVVETQKLPEMENAVGIDLGIKEFATFSDGTLIHNPKWFKKSQAKLRVLQRSIQRKKIGSKNRRKAVLRLRKFYVQLKNQKNEFQHQVSRKIIDNFGLIAVENLNIRVMVKSNFSKQILDAGWGGFLSKLTYKAEEAGRKFIKVSPKNTSQNCSRCGERVQKSLSIRIHSCNKCGLILDRDVNAAKNILTLAQGVLDKTYVIRQSVSKKAVGIIPTVM